MGGVAALLAGACVAPVVISVLLLSASLYARGVAAGLLLPFVLGLGMALPWPFAGAGLSFLPGPGRWMQWVKYGFGVFIVGFALWYGRLGVSLLRERSPASAQAVAASRAEQIDEGGWLTSLPEALAESARSGKPVLIDFWATWCKNCLQMDKTTFQDPAVTQRLASYVKVKFQAEDIRAETTRAVLDRFGVIGLPTYVVLAPGAAAGGSIQ
jgi:thiol:disulfide interchange protein